MEDDNVLIAGAKKGTHRRVSGTNLGVEKEYSEENFKKYFLDSNDLSALTKLCESGRLEPTRCRWNAWRAFLKVLDVTSADTMKKSLDDSRKIYYTELEKYTSQRDSVKDDPLVNNPLSKAASNPWNSFFEDSDLRQTIKQDIDRTHQEKEFFSSTLIKDMMMNILFVWSKNNATISYRQGMNELAAVILFVCYRESIGEKVSKTTDTMKLLGHLNDEKHVEADAFTFFNRIMSTGHAEMFAHNQARDPKVKYIPEEKRTSEILKRSAKIQDVYLQVVDKELHGHLKSRGVEPQIYLLRWIRCMVVREFHLQDAMVFWDLIFSDFYTSKSKHLDLIDDVCLAMIQFVRLQLLAKDDAGYCLQRLLKYPPIEDLSVIINLTHKNKEILATNERLIHTLLNPHAAHKEAAGDKPKKEFVLLTPSSVLSQGKPGSMNPPKQSHSLSPKDNTSPVSNGNSTEKEFFLDIKKPSPEVIKKAETFTAMIDDLIKLIREEKVLTEAVPEKLDVAIKSLNDAKSQFTDIKLGKSKKF